ncbi:hypothetical protein [Fodinicurvata halophila]|uniref:hypothetical protein n=1 Tax=Fodinicurvata halophila TaxID=1419723 RepID=UPI00362A7451
MGCDGAHELVTALAERLKAPVGWTLKGKMFLEHDNDHGIGMTGFIGGKACADAIAQCDALLLLGTDFPWKDFLHTKARVAQVLTHGERLGRRTHVDMGLIGDVRATLEALLPHVRERADDSFLKDRRKVYHADLDSLARHEGEQEAGGDRSGLPGRRGKCSCR